MRVIEIIERECCGYEDFIPLLGTEVQLKEENGDNFINNQDNTFHYVMCIHCNSVHEYYRFTDAAGSMDWEYRKVK